MLECRTGYSLALLNGKGPHMAIVVTCQCGKQYKVKDELAGKRAKCHNCQATIEIPVPAVGETPLPGASAPSPVPSEPVDTPRIESPRAPSRRVSGILEQQLAGDSSLTLDRISDSPVRSDLGKLGLAGVIAVVVGLSGAYFLLGSVETMYKSYAVTRRSLTMFLGGHVVTMLLSWMLMMLGVIIGGSISIRVKNKLTLERWRVFWRIFTTDYVIGLGLLGLATWCLVRPSVWQWAQNAGLTKAGTLPGAEQLPLALSALLFASAFVLPSVIGFLHGIRCVFRTDARLRAQFSLDVPFSSWILAVVQERDWASVAKAVSEMVTRTNGLLRSEVLLARLYTAAGAEELSRGNAVVAQGLLEKATSSDASFIPAKYHLGRALADAGEIGDASRLLREFTEETDDKKLRGPAKELASSLQQAHGITLRCPECKKAVRGTRDMIGDEGVCPSCKATFPIDEGTVVV